MMIICGELFRHTAEVVHGLPCPVPIIELMCFDLSSLIVSVASLIVSVMVGYWSIKITRNALRQAEQIADRTRSDWRQKQWFDLYLECDASYDLLDRFQNLAKTLGGAPPSELKIALDAVILQLRKVQALALVFPECTAIDDLVGATTGIKSEADALSPERLPLILKASEGIRTKARVDPDVL